MYDKDHLNNITYWHLVVLQAYQVNVCTRENNSSTLHHLTLDVYTIPIFPHVRLNCLSWNDGFGETDFYGLELGDIIVGKLFQDMSSGKAERNQTMENGSRES